MTIATLPSLDRTSPTFKTDVDTFFATQLPTFSTDINALQVDVSAKQAIATNAANTATTQAGIATTQAGLATTNGAAQVSLATVQANNAQGSAYAAAASAASALNAPGTSATSTTSLPISLGSHSLTIQTGKAYAVGQFVVIANTPTPSNYMFGQITSFTSGTGALVVSVSTISGSGTFTDWTVALSAVASNTGASLGTNTFTGAQIYSDQQLSRGLIKDFGYVFLDKGNSGTTNQVIDYTAGSHQKITVTGSHIISTTNWPPSGNLGDVLLELTNAGSATLTFSLGTTTNWIKSDGSYSTTFAGAGVTLQTSGTDWICMWTRDAGVTVFVKVIR